MKYATEYIYEELREARLRKGLSQRELSILSGVPQSHISKVESGAVDLRVSSLVAIARVLDLELLLVAKNSLPAVEALLRLDESESEGGMRDPAYQLEDEDE